jgi:hypothetical protein
MDSHMSAVSRALSWIGTMAASIALLTLAVTVLVAAGFYTLSDTTPAVGFVEVLLPTVLVAGGFLVWLVSKLGLRHLDESSPAEPTSHGDSETELQQPPTADEPSDEPQQPPTGDESTAKGRPLAPDADRTLAQFTTANFYLSAVFACLLGLSIASSGIQALVQGTPVAVVAGFLVFAAQVTGGTLVHLANVLLFGGAWFGLRKHSAKEAWLLGMAGWSLVTISGIGLLTRSLGAIAIVIGGLKVLSVGFPAREGADWVFLDEYLSNVAARPSNQPDTGDSSETPDTEGTSNAGHIAAATAALRNHDLRDPSDVWAALDVELEVVHPRDAGDAELSLWSYLSYALGGLTLLSTLLVGVQVWGLPSLGLWGVPIGLVYLGHAVWLPQRSPVIHVAGLGWYLITLLLAIVTLSPLAIVATAGGVYLGWSTTRDLRDPEAVLGELRRAITEPDSPSGPLGELRGGGIAAGIVLGGTFGLLGAVVFALVSVETRSVYGILLLVPPVAAGYGVATGIGEGSAKIKGLVAAGVATVSIVLAFRLLTSFMPQRYQLQPEPLLAVVPLVGIYAAYKLAASHSGTGEERQPAQSTADSGRSASESDGT